MTNTNNDADDDTKIFNLEDENDKFFINELLAYLCHYVHNSTITNIKNIIVGFYSFEEIVKAKKLLWELGKDHLDAYIERRTTDRRTCSEASLDDIVEAVKKLDMSSNLPNFVAKNIANIPNNQPEELNLMYIVKRVNSLENKISTIDEVLINNESHNEIIKDKINSYVENVNNIVEELREVKYSLDSKTFINNVLKKDFVVEMLKNIIINECLCNCTFRSDEKNTNLLGCNESLPKHAQVSDKLYTNFVSCDKDIPVSPQVLDKVNNSVLGSDTEVPKNVELMNTEDNHVFIDAASEIQNMKNKSLDTAELVDDEHVPANTSDLKHNKLPSQCENSGKLDEIDDHELEARFKKIRFSDNENDFMFDGNCGFESDTDGSFNDRLNDDFEEFLDNFNQKKIDTASFSEFENKKKRLSLHDSLDTFNNLRSYNEALKSNIDSFIGEAKVSSGVVKSRTKIIDKSVDFLPPKIVDEEGYVMKESRNSYRRRKNALLADMENDGLVGPSPKKITLWVYHVLKGDENIVRNYIEDRNVRVYHISKTSHDQASLKSFKIEISRNDRVKILNKLFFPDGVKCRVWRERSGSNKNYIVTSRTFNGKLYKDTDV